METRFSEWLVGQLRERGWSQRELARRSDVSHTTVSDVLGNVRRPTWDFCASIAGPLERQPDEVFVLAGLKPEPSQPVSEEAEALRILRELTQDLRIAAVAMLRGLAGERPADSPIARESDLERELLEAFRQLSPRWQAIFVEDARQAANMGMVRMIGDEGAGEDGKQADDNAE